MMINLGNLFPLQISVIDQDNPFFFDVSTYSQANKLFGEDVLLEVEYKDLSGNSYNYNTRLGISGSVPPFTEVLNVKILRILSKLCVGIDDTKFEQLMTLFSINKGFYLGETQTL